MFRLRHMSTSNFPIPSLPYPRPTGRLSRRFSARGKIRPSLLSRADSGAGLSDWLGSLFPVAAGVEREAHGEGRSLSFQAAHPYAPAMEIGDVSDDREL